MAISAGRVGTGTTESGPTDAKKALAPIIGEPMVTSTKVLSTLTRLNNLGYWLHHEQSGHGKLVWANGNAFEGTWVRGDKREGEFFEKPSGRRFQGKLPPSSEIQVSVGH